ncbi:MAG TPA: M15 family metallopeptidase [Candidatus Saccharimonadales bacterium]
MYLNSRLRQPSPRPRRIVTPKIIFIGLLLILATTVLAGGTFLVQRSSKKEGSAKTSTPTEQFNKKLHSLTDPTSPWVVVNKKRQLSPKNYAPTDLRTPSMSIGSASQRVSGQTAVALEALAKAAASEGVNLMIISAYRSYETQINIYNSEVRGFGQAQADRESARPGHSEHQTGWAADIGTASGKCEIKTCFADTSEGQWLAANAYKYGFVIRYPDGKEHITGYMYEPWHIRFVGTELSGEMYKTKTQTLEEFFGLPAAPGY